MKPIKVTFYVYADDEGQVHDLETSLYSFVDGMFNKGTLVTAKKLTELIGKVSSNPFIQNLLR